MVDKIWTLIFSRKLLIFKLFGKNILPIISHYLMITNVVEQVSQETGSEIECYLQMFYFQVTVPMTMKMARLGRRKNDDEPILWESQEPG